MLDLKPYGAFIENTIRPMIEEAQTLLSDLHGYGLYLTKEDLWKALKVIGTSHLITVIVQSIANIIIVAIICGTVWTISAS